MENTLQENREYWFSKAGRKQRGYVKIQTLLEEALEMPGILYSNRRRKLGEAEQIALMIPNEKSRQIYLEKVEKAKKQTDKRYACDS